MFRKNKMNKGQNIFLICTLFILMIIFTSCKSYLDAKIKDYLAILPDDTSVFISLDTAAEPELSWYFMNRYVTLDESSRELLEKTNRIYGGLQSAGNKNSSEDKPAADFAIAAAGNFPRGTINLAFSTKKEWKRLGNQSDLKTKIWENTLSGLNLAVPSHDLLLASNYEIMALIDNLSENAISRYSEGTKQIFHESALAVFIPLIGRDKLSEFSIGSEHQILKSLLFSVQPQKNGRHELRIEIALADEKDVKGFRSILKTWFLGIIRKFGKEETALFRKESVLETDSNIVVFSSVSLLPEHLKVFLTELLFLEGDGT